jgi:DNA topoisomerase VI subunit B
MKYDVNQYSDVEVQSTTDDRDITLSADSTSMIFQIFTKNMYGNPIGSVVREITSNCFDSHIEANVNLPVVIRKTFDKLTSTHYISFIDYGVGMSPERIRDVFAIMFSSTKRGDEKQIGQWGVGSKTPLAYRRKTGLGEE